MLSCAALVGAMFMLMGAGYRVFTYLAYVPGQGIVTQEIEDVFTLQDTIPINGNYVEAISMVPAADEEHEGQWEVTLLTNKTIYGENGLEKEPSILLTDSSGNTCTLDAFSGGSGKVTKYRGYIDHAAEGEYTLRTGGTEYTAFMQSLENSVYANYQYPVDQGVTLVCFPMANGSEKLVFDIILEPESENMAFWQQHAEYITASVVCNVTDINGNTYYTHSQTGSVLPNRNNARVGLVEALDYKAENILTLDRRLEAPVASISVDKIELHFEWLRDLPAVALTVPELDEVIETEETVLWDMGGVQLTYDRISSYYYESGNIYEIALGGYENIHDFTENVVYVHTGINYASPETPDKTFGGSSGSNIFDNVREFHKDIVGYGDKKIRHGSIDVTFGDEILLKPGDLHLHVAGNWLIDFTTPAESK